MSTLSPPQASTARTVTGLTLRDSTDADMEAIQAIYAAHVLRGTGTFEEVAPDVTEIARRRADILARRLPYLVGGFGLGPRTAIRSRIPYMWIPRRWAGVSAESC